MDLAVGVIIGGAFNAITSSLVNDIINPILGIFAGDGQALTALAIRLPGGGALMVGNFLNAVLSFLIMAFVVFCLMKAVNGIWRKKEAAPPPPPTPLHSFPPRRPSDHHPTTKNRRIPAVFCCPAARRMR